MSARSAMGAGAEPYTHVAGPWYAAARRLNLMEILKIRFRTNEEFQQYYDDSLGRGGLFCPTTTPLEVGQPVIVELSVPALPNKVLIRGVVRKWRPALPRLRVRAGATVEFDADEANKRDFVLGTVKGTATP